MRSAKPATPPKRKRSPQPKAGCGKAAASPPATGIDAERRGLKLFLRQRTGFGLALALYNDPVARDALVRELGDSLAKENISLRIIDLLQPAQEHTLLDRVESVVKTVKAGERLALMIINLETRVDYNPELHHPGSPGLEFLATANLHRELFDQTCPFPIVIWMTELLERAFVKQAPDLWQWRNHVFDLRTRMKPIEMPAPDGSRLRSSDFRLHPEIRLQRLEEELAAYRKAGARRDEMRILNAIGLARLHIGDARLARNDFEQVLRIAREIGDRRGEGATLGNLGNAHFELGDARQAIKFYEQHLIIAREIGDRRGEGNALGNLGNAHLRMGDARQAIKFYEKCLVLHREIGDRLGESATLGNLGNAHAALGDARKAIALYEQTLAVSREIGNRRREGQDLVNLGIAHAVLGDARKAIGLFEQQLVIAREIGDRRGEGNGLWNSALAYDLLGNPPEAIACAEAALRLFEAVEDPKTAKVRAKLAEWRGRQTE